MSFRKKLENFWYHYKFPTLIISAIAICAIFLIIDYVNKVEYDLAVAYVGSDFVDHITFEPIADEIKAASGDADRSGEVHVRFTTIVMPEIPQNQMDLAKKDQFNYTFLDSTVRVYIAEKNYFEEKSLFFMPLHDILPEEELTDVITREGKAIATSLKGNETLEKLGMDSDRLYIGVRAQTYEDKKDEFIDERTASSINVMKYFLSQH